MLSQQLDGGRLRALLARFLREADARADGQMRWIAEDAVAMEIDLAPVARLDEARFAGGIDPRDRPDWLSLVVLHIALQPADLVLQFAACALERIVEGEGKVRLPL